MEMHRGNFDITDFVEERVGLRYASVESRGQTTRIHFSAFAGQPPLITMLVFESGGKQTLSFEGASADTNRFWLRVIAEPREHIWGGGEQMSYFNLAGRHFPLWTSEPGVGRDKTQLITWQADQAGRGGGDYYHTNYPQPTYLSSRRYALHVETTAYSAFDFRNPEFHEIEVWSIPERIELWSGSTFLELVETLADRFGKQPMLPKWIYNGAIIGLKDGENSFPRLERILTAGAHVSGLWCEDWVGIRETSFGKRLFWDWRWSQSRYPQLPTQLAALAARGVKFLGYVNPYLCVDGTLYGEAESAGFLATRLNGERYLVDFGEFLCGIVDFTNEEAADWFAERVIGQNMLDFGLSGWMADFGEYLPIDVKLANRVDAKLMHNAWPTLWAEVNARAIESRGGTGEVIFFMRAGFTGVQRYCPLLWAGDQCVDFSRHDGIGTVICGALSSGLLGNAYHHSDIGGYTSLFGNVRTPELLQRWSEMAAFTPVMRTHEGNRPAQNLQIDQDETVLKHFVRMTQVYRHLAPYLSELSRQAVERGLPVQRPLFLHFEQDARAYEIQDQYLYGPELLIAPVLAEGARERSVYFPEGAQWTHVWSGARYAGGAEHTVPAPLGQPPVFYRHGAAFQSLFDELKGL
jgi:alpha-glucosidase